MVYNARKYFVPIRDIFVMALMLALPCACTHRKAGDGPIENDNEHSARVENQSNHCSCGEADEGGADGIDLEGVRMIRKEIFESKLSTYSVELEGGLTRREVTVPDELVAAYQTNGNLVIEHLLWIGRYGRPDDALKALVYSGALVIGRDSRPIVTLASSAGDPEMIDVPHANGKTDREFFLEVIEANVK